MSDSPQLICIGEGLIQLAPPAGQTLADSGTLDVYTGGAEMNVAMVARGFGIPTAFLSRVGADALGERIVGVLSDAGVDVSRVERDSTRVTGMYVKDTGNAVTSMRYYRSGSAASCLGPEHAAHLRQFPSSAQWIHTTGITAALSSSASMLIERILVDRSHGARVSFDINFRPSLWAHREAADDLAALASRADLLFVGLDEAETLWDCSDPDDVRAFFPDVPEIVVKDGARAAVSLTAEGSVREEPLHVDVVEPVGAGDAFAAGYLSARILRKDTRTALRWGHLSAAAALQTVADHAPPLPRSLIESVEHMPPAEWSDLSGDLLSAHALTRG